MRTNQLAVLLATILLPGTAGSAAAQSLPPEKFAQLKAATAYIVVSVRGMRGSGSAFVVRNDGDDTYIVTNDHVINVQHAFASRGFEINESIKPTVKVFFESGTAKERSADATIVAADVDRDLAVLKVSKIKDPPAPINLLRAPKPVELMPLIICGFPLGKATAIDDQNPSATINALTISNIRIDLKTGRTRDIQVNGGMTFGNSGGPIVSAADAALVGVAVSGFNGTGIGYAIPRDEVSRVLAGTHGRIQILPANPDAKVEGPAQLRIAVVDPLKTVKSLTAYISKTAPAAKPDEKPALMQDAAKTVLAIKDGFATAEIAALPKGKLFVQVEVELAKDRVLSSPVEIAVALPEAMPSFHPPFSTPEPKTIPADLRARGPQDAKYPLPQDSAKMRELRTADQKWFHKQLVDPFRTAANLSKNFAGKVTETLEACTLYENAIQTFPRRLAYQDYCQAEIDRKTGSNHATLKFFQTVHQSVEDPPAQRAEALRAHCERLKKSGTLVQVLSAMHYAAALRAIPAPAEETMAAYTAAIARLADLAKDKNPAAERTVLTAADAIQAAYDAAGWDRAAVWKQIDQALKDASPALRKAIQGESLLKLKEPKYTEAKAAFEAAWQADEKCDTAAAGMVAAAAGMKLGRDEMEKWFQRALTANPDCYKACLAKLKYLDPEGTGKVAEALAFGRQCLRTRNYQAGLPYILVQAHGAGAMPFAAFAASLPKDEAAWADVREYYEYALMLTEADRDLLSEYALCCAAMKQWTAAKQFLTALKNKPAKTAFPSASEFAELVKQVDSHIKKPAKK